MNIIKPSHKIIRCTEGGVDAIADAARTCYLSEPTHSPELENQFISEVVGWNDRGRQSRAWHTSEFDMWIRDRFVTKLREMGHQTPFEFMDIEIEFICDRGVSHEAVRHRMCSPMQESTRYCNYSPEGKHGLNVIKPLFFEEHTRPYELWLNAMRRAEEMYNQLLEQGATPQEARSVLPNSLKTKLKIKANVREWIHIFQLRALNKGAHPQIREIMIPALKECAERWPVLFEWLWNKLKDENPTSGYTKAKNPEL